MPAAAGARPLKEWLGLLREQEPARDASSLLFTQESRDTRTTFSLLPSPCLKPERIFSLDQEQHHGSCCAEQCWVLSKPFLGFFGTVSCPGSSAESTDLVLCLHSFR